MAVEGLTQSLGSLLYRICRGGDEEEHPFGGLPNALILDILGRLPVETLVRCQREYQDLRALISSSYFTTLHVSQSASRPMIILHDFQDVMTQGNHLYVVFENINKPEVPLKKFNLRRHLMIHQWRGADTPCLRISCQGVVLFTHDIWPHTTYYVLNPLTQEEVTVRHTLQPGQICALYCCTLAKEFRILYAQLGGGTTCQYFVYSFKTKTWRTIGYFNFVPYGYPAVANGALHWITFTDLERKENPPCANGIMIFRMDKEELSTRPHPGSVCNTKQVHKAMCLLLMDGKCLCCCNLIDLGPVLGVDIWILEDYEMQAWNRKYRANINYPVDLRGFKVPREAHTWIPLFYIQDGILVFHLICRGLFLYNLEERTLRRFDWPTSVLFAFGPYVKSLVPIA